MRTQNCLVIFKLQNVLPVSKYYLKITDSVLILIALANVPTVRSSSLNLIISSFRQVLLQFCRRLREMSDLR